MNLAVFSLPATASADVRAIEHWLGHLRDGRHFVDFTREPQKTPDGGVIVYRLFAPSAAAIVLFDSAFSEPGRLQILSALWCQPACASGLAKELHRNVLEIAPQLRALAAAGIVHGHKGVWYVRPFQRGGEA